MDAVLTCLITDNIGPNLLSQRLVQTITRYLNVAGGVAVRRFSDALRFALNALGLQPGAKIVISPLSPAIYLNVFDEMGFTPLYADVDSDSACISVSAVEKLIQLNPDALLIHAPIGFAPDMEKLIQFGKPIVEDISEALGANTGIKHAGSYGRYALISLEPEKIITSGGGAVVLANSRRDLSHLNKVVDTQPEEIFLPDLNSSLGLIQIGSLEQFIERRKDIAQVFSRAVMKSKHKTLVQKGDGENIFFAFPVLLNKGMKDVVQYAMKKKIQVIPAFNKSALAVRELPDFPCPVARSLMLRCVLFPLYPSLGKANTEEISKVLSTLP
ncbi:MAG: DegT/DnrJ/EryC1/StrS family aminotransferase [Spirochaetota bacterium]